MSFCKNNKRGDIFVVPVVLQKRSLKLGTGRRNGDDEARKIFKAYPLRFLYVNPRGPPRAGCADFALSFSLIRFFFHVVVSFSFSLLPTPVLCLTSCWPCLLNWITVAFLIACIWYHPSKSKFRLHAFFYKNNLIRTRGWNLAKT